jgi:membrane associated rhomboid family serine protease
MAVCYRHPTRETNVSCSNCGRPICPDCMTSTPVGMRCPDCARERTQVRRVSFGGLAAGRAPATYALIAINVVFFIAELATGASGFEVGGTVYRHLALFGPAVDNGDWWRIITGGFLHAGLFHILLNMVGLYFLGSLLEPGIGTARFLGVYVVSLLAGSFGALLVTPATPTVGASGAIFGLLSAAFVMARHRGLEQLSAQIGFYIVINLVFTFNVTGISIGAHVGGLIGGALAALTIAFAERRRSRESLAFEVIVLVTLAAISFGGALWAAGQPNAVIG